MSYQNIFSRCELKYLITRQQQAALKTEMEKHMKPDPHGRSTIRSLYFDTPDRLLIRRSIEKPVYKEKLRVRSYSAATSDSTVFVELKKKFKSTVYKRRIDMTWQQACDYLAGRAPAPKPGQISREIDYFRQLYPGLEPAALIAYDREAYFGREDGSFRITFDENIRWRDHDLSLCGDTGGEPLLGRDEVLAEIKTSGAIPLWLTHFLTVNRINKTSFSKYGNAYRSAVVSRAKTA